MSVEIRSMNPEDYEAVEALWKASPGVGLSPTDTREGVVRFLERNRGSSFVAFREGALVGAVLCGHDGRRGFISHLAVESSSRRLGLGRALVERCIGALRESSIDKAHIFVFAENEKAVAFWKKIGWGERSELVMLSRYTA